MRNTRTEKKLKRKKYIKNLLLLFVVIIPITAVASAFALNYAMNRDENITTPVAVLKPPSKEAVAFKYNFDINPKELYRVEIKKYEKSEDAEASIISLKNKKLNGFIIKEQGYLTVYGLFLNKSQANISAGYLKRKGIQSTVAGIKINGFGMKYNDSDKTLIDLAKATDAVIIKISEEKAALSLESLYSDKKISEKNLEGIIENEARLEKYLNYLKTVEPSKDTVYLKTGLEDLIKEALEDRLSTEESYNYYDLQNSLLNQVEALRKFYDKLIV